MLSSTLFCHALILTKISRKCKNNDFTKTLSLILPTSIFHTKCSFILPDTSGRGWCGGRKTYYIKSLISAAIVSHSVS